jgi:hypothetical protein
MDLKGFAADVIENLGGVIETGPNGSAEVLLPPELAADLGLPEESRLVDRPDASTGEGGGLTVCYGSDILDKLIRAAAGAHGRASAVRIEAPAVPARTAEAAALNMLQPRNGAVRLLGSAPVRAVPSDPPPKRRSSRASTLFPGSYSNASRSCRHAWRCV